MTGAPSEPRATTPSGGRRALVVPAVLVVLALLAVWWLLPPRQRRFERTVHLSSFLKGNTHAHTNRSGDARGDPADVARWYKSHGYAFLVITDHHRNGPAGDQTELEDAAFIVIEGQEYTGVSETDGKETHPHVNGLGTTNVVPRVATKPTWEQVQYAVREIVAQGGVAQIDHPNQRWSLTVDDIARIEGASLLEVANAHPAARSEGNDHHEPVERMWDRLLGKGRRLWGVACDDAHALPDDEGRKPAHALPGHGWVQVAAPALTDAEVLAALERGDHYFSTGAEFAAIDVEGESMSVRLADGTPADATIEFVGGGGRELMTAHGTSAVYATRGGEDYVRVRVTVGKSHAWTQPYFLRR